MIGPIDNDTREYRQYTTLTAVGPGTIKSMLRAAVNEALVKHVVERFNELFNDVQSMQSARENIVSQSGRKPSIKFEITFEHIDGLQPQDRDEIRNVFFNAGWTGCTAIAETHHRFTVMVSDDADKVFPT